MIVLTIAVIKYSGLLSWDEQGKEQEKFADAWKEQNNKPSVGTPVATATPEPTATPIPTPTPEPVYTVEFTREYPQLGAREEVYGAVKRVPYGLRYPAYEEENIKTAVALEAESIMQEQMALLADCDPETSGFLLDYENGRSGQMESVLFYIEREADGVVTTERKMWLYNKKKGEVTDTENLFSAPAYRYVAKLVNDAAEAEDAKLTGVKEEFSTFLFTEEGVRFYYENNGAEETITVPYVELHTYMAVTVNGTVVADTIRDLDPDAKMVALTFDDGPHYINTPRLLKILEENDARATFFLLGDRSVSTQANKDTVGMIAASGNEIASHTYSHKQLSAISKEKVIEEISKTRETLFELTGEYPTYVRPPYGSYNDTVKKYCFAPLITWNLDSEDWKSRDTATIVAHVMDEMKDRRIVLMHDIHTCTIDAAEQLIPLLKAEGYEIVTLTEMFYYKGVELENGGVYHNGY